MFPGGHYQDQSLGAGQVRICGSFLCNGTGAVSDVKGKGFYIARADTGDFKVSLGANSSRRYPFRALLAWNLSYQGADGDTATLKLNSTGTDVTSSTDPAVVITNAPSGTPTDLTSVRVSFELILATSELNK